MEFDEALINIFKSYGLSVFDGKKSLYILNDFNAFQHYPGLKIIFTEFLAQDGNLIIANKVYNKSNVINKHRKKFLNRTGFRSDMVAYIYETIENINGVRTIGKQRNFPNPFDPYFKTKTSIQPKHFNWRIWLIRATVICCLVISFIIGFLNDEDTTKANSNARRLQTEYNTIEVTVPTDEVNAIQEDEKDVLDEFNFQSGEGIDVKNKQMETTSHISSSPSPTEEVNISSSTKFNLPSDKTNDVDIIEPQVDKSEYLSLAKKYMETPSTHHLADKYARLALANGQLEAKQIISQLKNLGFYE